MGPHTSNWDFILKMAFISYGIKAKYLIKKEAFFFSFWFFLRKMGGIPVDEKRKNNITQKAKTFFRK